MTTLLDLFLFLLGFGLPLYFAVSFLVTQRRDRLATLAYQQRMSQILSGYSSHR